MNVNLVPAKPDRRVLSFMHGIPIDDLRFGVLISQRKSEIYSLPMMVILEAGGTTGLYFFECRFDGQAKFSGGYPLEGFDESYLDQHDLREALISLEYWQRGLASYYDFLAAEAEEKAAEEEGQTRTHHLVLDQIAVQGHQKQRRLIGSYFTRLGAAYALRHESAWRQAAWEHGSRSGDYWRRPSSRYFEVTQQLTTPNEVRVQLTTSYPFSRGRRAPFTMVWRWHLSRQVPLVEAGSVPANDVGDDRDERWTHRPGDPKILRETGTGLFGSYPSFEGDDEPEYQDEQ
ncbi:hypothetical protein [Deinococcus sp. 6GRE01]|uniref:hypothetical protein n=1 Tax=Deinococcus sp. 6GRE01 TaxID=2745873 RepID=UPI001E4FE43B|nr:hypothetical protein [Deinococcus sp. 6GRE01]MCD0157003.1 hypothetical protein [Deinococcus sp. 6GRE01]